MRTGKIREGCNALDKLNINIAGDHHFMELVRVMDATTKHQIQAAVEEVLKQRKAEISEEIKGLVNQ